MYTLDRAVLNLKSASTKERSAVISNLEIFHSIFLFLGVKFFPRIFYL